MDLFTLMSGLQLTCIYGLLAIGVSIVWSSLGLLNLAHGFTFAAAGFGAWWAAVTISKSAFVVFAAGILTGGFVGVIIYLVAFLYIHDKPNYPVRALIATMAINLIGVQTLMWMFGPRMKPIPQGFWRWILALWQHVCDIQPDRHRRLLRSCSWRAAAVAGPQPPGP